MSKKQFRFGQSKPTRTLDIAGHEFEIGPLNPSMSEKLYALAADFTDMKEDESSESAKLFVDKVAELVDYLLGEGASEKIFEEIAPDSVWERMELITFLKDEFLAVTNDYQQKFDVSRIQRKK